jgi:hypothetical protein
VITAVVSVPNPPLLLPGMTGAPVVEVEELRAACLTAIGTLRDCASVVIVAGVRAADSTPPLALAVARALLSQGAHTGSVRDVTVSVSATTTECAAVGRALAVAPDPVGLLVMADGSARRTLKAPGYLDDRAAPFDAAVLAQLETGDWSGLLELDVRLADELLVAGRAPWQVAAAALTGTDLAVTLHYQGDPFGVWYPVLSYR